MGSLRDQKRVRRYSMLPSGEKFYMGRNQKGVRWYCMLPTGRFDMGSLRDQKRTR